MAVTRRGFIFGAFLSSLLSVFLIVVALSTDSWVVSTAVDSASDVGRQSESTFSYGLFKGELLLGHLNAPTNNDLFMVCLLGENACAVTCKTSAEARRAEVLALSQGVRTNPSCSQFTTEEDTPLEKPAVIPASFYVSLVAILSIYLLVSVTSAVLALVNATMNPTEPMFGLPGVLWCNATAAVVGAVVIFMWGIYWAVTDLQEHLAFSFTAVGDLVPQSSSLGYSYWVVIGAILFNLLNIVLLKVREYLLEKDPPPPTITIENHSDGTIFLY